MISALSRSPLLNTTVISSASEMTWLLVMTMPSGSTTKPDPSELTRRGPRLGASPCWPGPPRRFLKNSSKNSSNGEPGGNCGVGPLRCSTFCEVEMLTTASITCSATSAMPSGPRAAAGIVTRGSATAAPTTAAMKEGEIWRIRELRWPAMMSLSPGQGVAASSRKAPTGVRLGPKIGTRLGRKRGFVTSIPSRPDASNSAAHQPY